MPDEVVKQRRAEHSRELKESRTREEEMFLRGWRACEHHLQLFLRKDLAEDARGVIMGYHVSWSDERALAYFNEVASDEGEAALCGQKAPVVEAPPGLEKNILEETSKGRKKTGRK